MAPRTLTEKIWDAHVVHAAEGEPDLLFIDLHLLHEVTSPQAFDGLRLAGRTVRRPDLTVATADHNVPTTDIDKPVADPISAQQLKVLDDNTAEFGITCYPMGHANQGIVHIIGPEQGWTQPGMTIVCGDSHTSTHGAFGALAFGIGTSEVEHVLATQTLPQVRPQTMAVTVEGDLAPGVTAKDVALAIIGTIGTGGGIGHVIEYRGSAIRGLSMEGRMTLCNMSIEGGARAGLVAPDETTFAYVKGRDRAPQGDDWDAALAYWRTLPTDEGATFDKEVVLDAATITPHVTWGTNPAQVAPITGNVPDPDAMADDGDREAARARPGLHGTPGRDAVTRDQRRHGVPGQLHQLAHRGLPGRRRRAGGPDRAQGAASTRRSRVTPGEGPGRSGRARQGLPGCGFRVARAGLLHVPRHEPRQARRGRALRLNLEPQLRGPSGPRRAHAPGLPCRRRRHCRGGDARHPGGPRLMEPVVIVTGRAVPLDRTDVDTDQIIPSDWLKRVERTGFGAGLFSEWRDDRDFVLNKPDFVGATILVAGHNFGTGSSREHAVWALMDFGFQAVVSSRFADIFRNNSTKQGLLPVQVTEELDRALLDAVTHDPSLELTIDVARGTIEAPAAGLAGTFPLDEFTRERLLNGWDDIGLSLRHVDEISDFERGRPAFLPSA